MKAKLKPQMLRAEMGRQEPEDRGRRAEGRGEFASILCPKSGSLSLSLRQ